MLVDTHCHLDYLESGGLDAPLAAAAEVGVVALQTISTRISQADYIIDLARRCDRQVASLRVFCSVGLHPLYVAEEGVNTANGLVDLCRDELVIGIGETGLDYYRCTDQEEKKQQQRSFIEHIVAAQETGLPLIIHSRDAEEDTVALLAEHLAVRPFGAVIHCFTGSQWLADAALELGFFLSASGIITFKNAAAIQEVFAKAPLDRLLIETDSPYLAPIPHRGKQNQPAYVVEVARCLATLQQSSFEEVCEVTTRNFQQLFAKVGDRVGNRTGE